jgi:hypothetical protein
MGRGPVASEEGRGTKAMDPQDRGRMPISTRGIGRTLFAAVLLTLAGLINLIYGIGALAGARIFVGETRFILTDVNALGWVLIILAVIQLTGGASLMAGAAYGRVIGRRPGRAQAALRGLCCSGVARWNHREPAQPLGVL